MKRLINKILFIIGCFNLISLASVSLQSCTDKEIIEPSTDENTTGSETPCDGYALSFSVFLDKEVGTRGEDPIDNYIDTKDKFRVLFFDKDYNFIFEAVDRTINPVKDEATGTDLYHVHIPMNYLVDRDGNIYDAEAIRNKLKDESFTVAVLANWPNKPTLIEEEGDPDENGTVIRPEPYYQKGEPLWGYYNSVTASTEDQKNSKFYLRNINDLHHLEVNSAYFKESTSDNRPHPKNVYKMIMPGDKMGVRTNWVSSQFKDAGEAETWIRANWDPSTAGAMKYLTYYDYLWYIWSFSVAYSDNNDFYSNVNGKKSDWITKNHGTDSSLKKFINGGLKVKLDDQTDDAELYFDASSFATNNGKAASIISKGNLRALRLPNSANGTSSGTQNDRSKPYGIRVKLNSTGTLRVTFASSDGKSTRLNFYDVGDNSNSSIATISETSPTTKPKSVSITEDPKTYYIYCDQGTAADIYEIEYINDQYLYETTREAVEPIESNPIPMYGVQNFAAIGSTNWKEGSTYDISTQKSTDNKAKIIYLVRSLAKVEIYLPTKYGKPNHVFMRSCNRYAFAEPVDVQSPRDWHMDKENPHDYFEGNWNQGNYDKWCEWHNIRYFGKGYMYKYVNETTSNKDQMTKDYQEWLHWYYGSWEAPTTKWLDKGTKPWSFTGIGSINTPYPSPHIFNPSIDRSDYARMIDKGQEGEYYKYIMYMPDKNIDDPNYPGVTNSIAKVAHVEYRYNSDANLNDNECYRIYFMDYQDTNSEGALSFVSGLKKNEFEKKLEQIPYEAGAQNDYLWPIMRNHIYTFKVKSDGNVVTDGIPVIISSVREWGYEKINVEW